VLCRLCTYVGAHLPDTVIENDVDILLAPVGSDLTTVLVSAVYYVMYLHNTVEKRYGKKFERFLVYACRTSNMNKAIRCIYIVAIRLASKFTLDWEYISGHEWARYSCVKLSLFNDIERRFLKTIGYRLKPNEDMFRNLMEKMIESTEMKKIDLIKEQLDSEQEETVNNGENTLDA
jgi:hypothetical protein